MNFDQIRQQITSLAKNVEDNHKIATPILASKLAKNLSIYPEDKTMGSMLMVIEKMADNNTLFITRATLKNLYGKLYTNNTRFAQVFSDELGTVEVVPEVVVQRNDVKDINLYEISDPILANALNSVFDKTLPLKMYSAAFAGKAKIEVNSSLDMWGLKPNALEVVDGNDRFLVLQASYETPKGMTSFYIPVEVKDNKIAEATMFMGNTGVEDLDNKNIKSYILSNAGSKLRVSGSSILDALVKSSSENRVISDAELALTRLHATREGKADFHQGQIIGQKVSEACVKDVVVPKSNEFVSFEKQFTTPAGIASFTFGDAVVKTAKDSLVRDLINLGYTNSQVAILDSNESSVFYGVSLDAGKVAFTVPVKVSGGKIIKPGVMISNGSMLSFDAESINKLYSNNTTDYKVAAAASPLFDLKPSDLINTIRDAVSEGNHAKAEDALNVLKNTDDKKAYATGFYIYMNGLNIKTASVEPKCKCSLMIKNSTSTHPICGHTGLPITKVYQDKDGSCRPLWRRGMEETYEAATFMNAKVLGKNMSKHTKLVTLSKILDNKYSLYSVADIKSPAEVIENQKKNIIEVYNDFFNEEEKKYQPDNASMKALFIVRDFYGSTDMAKLIEFMKTFAENVDGLDVVQLFKTVDAIMINMNDLLPQTELLLEKFPLNKSSLRFRQQVKDGIRIKFSSITKRLGKIKDVLKNFVPEDTKSEGLVMESDPTGLEEHLIKRFLLSETARKHHLSRVNWENVFQSPLHREVIRLVNGWDRTPPETKDFVYNRKLAEEIKKLNESQDLGTERLMAKYSPDRPSVNVQNEINKEPEIDNKDFLIDDIS